MNQNKLFLPISIIVAGLIIAGAVMFTNKDSNTPKQADANLDDKEKIEVAVREVSSEDHILGNPDADVVIVEYSDFECPFCARFHPTMENIMEEYGARGKVAWVYRHFPLRQIHDRAQETAEASECVADISGNDVFWKFSAKIFSARNEAIDAQDNDALTNSLTNETLKSFALELGVDEVRYDSCVADHTFKEKVDADYADGLNVAQSDPKFGTPYSIILSKNGVETTIAGAQPYSLVKQIVDTVLGE